MSFATYCLVLGAAAWTASWLLKALFVDRSDADNPLRALVVGLGYAGIAAVAWGGVLLAAAYV